jgi:hypothetical protein
MKHTVMQYVSLTVMLLLIVVVVSLLPERAQSTDNTPMQKSTAAVSGISHVKSAVN